MSTSINKALNFARFAADTELKSVGALRKALKKGGKSKALKSQGDRLEVLQQQIKIRKYVYRVFRPVPGAWLSGKKADLLAKVGELTLLVEDMIRNEQKEVGRRRPKLAAAPDRGANPYICRWPGPEP